jgi:DNA polymerase I-like protein with 3'-5' exonuclease and polymerase domains/5'-3' exonuclease
VDESYHILDLNGLLLKRFHGCSDQSVEDGDRTISAWQPALLDFIDAHLLPYLDYAAPRQFIAVWDKGNAFRLNLWPNYKKKRLAMERSEAMTREVRALREHAGELLAYLGVKQVWVPGEEADDVIALLCAKLPGHKTVHTVDHDLLVLVNEHTSVMRNGELHGAGSFAYPGKVPYALLSLYLALVGDTSDGYGGVSGFGEAAWTKLYERLGHDGAVWLQWVIANDQPEHLLPYVESDRELSLLYHKWPETRRGWQLASLHPEACYGSYRASNGRVRPKRPEWRVRVPNQDRVRRVLAACYDYTVLDVLADEAIEQALAKFERFFPTQALVDGTNRTLPKLMSEILASPIVSYDFESSDKLNWPAFRQASDKNYVDVLAQELAGISINWGDNLQHTIYIPFDHRDTANLPLDWAEWLLSSLSSRDERCVVQNAAFELAVAQRNLGYMPRAPYDTAIMASYVDENEENHLKGMSQRWLGYQQLTYQDVTQGRAMCELSGEEVLRYGCDDSLVTSHLFDLFRLIMLIEGSWGFYQQYEVDPAVDDAHNFISGTTVDFAKLTELAEASKERMQAAEEGIRRALVEHTEQMGQQGAGEAAKTLLDEWWLTEQYKFCDNPEAGTARYHALWQRAWDACFYQTKTEQKNRKIFVPTITGLGEVVRLIDAEAPVPSKLTVAGLVEWKGNMGRYRAKALPEAVNADLGELVALVIAAKAHLGAGKRQGPAYEELAVFCQQILDERAPGKVVSSGTQLNFGSSPQMQEMLYGLLRLPVRRRSKPTEGSLRDKQKLPGSPATGLKAVASALVWDVAEGDWRKPVLEDYAVVCKERQLQSLYFEKYPLWPHPIDGKLHPQVRNCGTATRRPAGNSPNLLQVKKGDIRAMFPAGEGRVTVSLDFASQEICLTACASGDPVMLDAFLQAPRRDLHSLTAAGIAWSILPQLGVPCSGPMSYEEFRAGLRSEDSRIAKAYAVVRNKYAKACIAEGSLVLTDRGEVPIEKVSLDDLVWDGIEWVTHYGVVYKGVREVITYDGLTATPDHRVYLDSGGTSPFGKVAAAKAGPRIAVGASQGRPVRYIGGYIRGVLEDFVGKVSALCHHALWFVRKSQRPPNRKPASWADNQLPMRAEKTHRSQGNTVTGSVLLHESAMQQPGPPRLQELWGARYTEQVFLAAGVCRLHHCYFSSGGLLQAARRSYRQQRPLRAGESQGSLSPGEYGEYQTQHFGRVSRGKHSCQALLARIKDFTSRVSLLVLNRRSPDQAGGGPGDSAPLSAATTRRAKVYDIINAGPRHRFTVSDKVVSNCNFGVIYGSSALGVAETLQIAKADAERILDAFFALYKRVPQWQQEVAVFAREHGYVEMPFGSRRHAIEDLWSDDRKLSGRQDRQLSNAVIQSGAAEILKVVRQRMYDARMRERYQLRQVFPIYDEVTATVPIDLCKAYILELADYMRVTPPGYPVGMEVEASIGRTWGTQVEVGVPTAERIDQVLAEITA